MKRYARKKSRATKKKAAPKAKRVTRLVPPKAGKKKTATQLLSSSDKARLIWLKRNQDKARKIAVKKRPSKREVEQLKVLRQKIKLQKAVISGKVKAKPQKRPPTKAHLEALTRKRQAEKTQAEVQAQFAASQKALRAREKELAIASAAFQAELAKNRIALYEKYTASIADMKARLLELRVGTIRRNELELPKGPYRRPLKRKTRVDTGSKIHVPGNVFLNDPGAIEQIMFDARAQSLKLIPEMNAQWMATMSMLVYGQATFGSPPKPSLVQIADASLYQVQSFESTGAQPTRLGMLEKLEDKLETGAETPHSVVWLEFVTLQQFTPSEPEEQKKWRREQERKKRKLATKKKRTAARKKKRDAKLRKQRRAAARLALLTPKARPAKGRKRSTVKKSATKKSTKPLKSKKKTQTKPTKTPRRLQPKKSTTKKVAKPPKKPAKKQATKARPRTTTATKTKAKIRQKTSSSSRSKGR